jgi:CheY-like chemotaxis protein
MNKEPEATPNGAKLICIIDDDPIYQILIHKIIGISNTGYDSIGFTNGKEAFDYFMLDLNTNLPKIILLDLEMPIMDGWDFLDAIEMLDTQNTAIYIVSSSISHEDKERAKTFTKIKGYYSKPFDVEKIVAITNEISR